jgi:two-component system sensor histidine kinase PilS (NtrC family)
LQLLRSDEAGTRALGEEGARMLGIVHREAERLSGLVSEFLTYARPADPVLEPVHLRAVVDETIAAARQGAGDVDMVVEGPDIVALCDAGQIRQVLWNLVGNAAQALRPPEDSGSGPHASATHGGKVRVLLQHESGWATVHVDDDGPGVPEDIRARIFEPFFTTRPDGTGLGLAASHQMVTRFGGSLAVHASPLGGARFTIRLKPA